MIRTSLLFVTTFTVLAISVLAQSSVAQTADQGSLNFVVCLTRHGVRSPTGKSAQYDQYSSGKWPTWNVAPGYLTPHGFHLIELFGAYNRQLFSREGLFQSSGCLDVDRVTIYADSDQRTRETGKALGLGLFPHCEVKIEGLAEGTNDPLFHPSVKSMRYADYNLAVPAIAGRIGGDPANLTLAYHEQIAALDLILKTCGGNPVTSVKRTSLFDLPATLGSGQSDHAADLQGPLNTASTLAENLLLEYTEGMRHNTVGWGCVDGEKIRSLISLHTAATDFTQRTRVTAKLQASNLLAHISQALEQAISAKPLEDAISKPNDKALFLIGHDTNLENMAGLLSLDWIADGRRDDTPPGSAFVFELWKDRDSDNHSVRVYFTTQTLEQMRSSVALTVSSPPQRVQLFVPGCSRPDLSCSWEDFSNTVQGVIGGSHDGATIRH